MLGILGKLTGEAPSNESPVEEKVAKKVDTPKKAEIVESPRSLEKPISAPSQILEQL